MAIRHDSTLLPPPSLLTRVSWGAIFAGAASAIALTALMGMLGLAIGFGSIDLNEGDQGKGIPTATVLWWAVSTVIATGIGGFVAARLAGIPRGLTGALHGLAVWSVATIVILWLAMSAMGAVLGAAGSVISTTGRIGSGVVSTVGGGAIEAGGALIPRPSADQVSTVRDRVIGEARSIGADAGLDRDNVDRAQDALSATAADVARTPSDAGQDIQQLVDRLFQGPDAAFTTADRERLIVAIEQRSGVPRGEAREIASRWEDQANMAWSRTQTSGDRMIANARDNAEKVTDDALEAASAAAWGMFAVSLLGLIAAMLGAGAGAPTRAAVGGATTLRSDEDIDEHGDFAIAPSDRGAR